ncbi:hypothetical protein EGW08_005364 [Elysia chlorotica]|uniref:Uncharacterized protein n=1 Tax=Elysia chlorotica TaxID=188477 RepID=A0A3S1BF63_ELYCH|nr:hypothetical protein EGW08_005364 [Elysia chlorotica]
MILPDDKDPAIVWDPTKKKWVNADGTEDETQSAAPPPTDSDLMGKPPSGGPPLSNSTGLTGGGAPPPMQAGSGANRFSLKAKGARNQYVDVNNPKPVAVPSNLFNVMPGAPPVGNAALPQVLMPGAAPPTDGSQMDSNTNSSQGLLSVPENDQPPPAADVTVNNSAPPQLPQLPQMPMMFNPASLKGNQGSAASAGTGMKYGQRRAYPK